MSNPGGRWAGALIAALLLSILLFWFMQWMVMNNNNGLQQTSNIKQVDFIRIQKDTTINKKQRLLKPKPQPEPPPQPDVVQPQPTKPLQSPAPQMDIPNIDIPITTQRLSVDLSQGIAVNKQPISSTSGLGKPRSGLIPTHAPKPRYPLRAQSRNIEGWVVVEFTITPTGSVIDAIVSSAKPEGVFNRAALKAIVKWRFKPKVEDGKAVAQRAVQRMEFNLDRRRR